MAIGGPCTKVTGKSVKLPIAPEASEDVSVEEKKTSFFVMFVVFSHRVHDISIWSRLVVHVREFY